jgi:hypothetical protein
MKPNTHDSFIQNTSISLQSACEQLGVEKRQIVAALDTQELLMFKHEGVFRLYTHQYEFLQKHFDAKKPPNLSLLVNNDNKLLSTQSESLSLLNQMMMARELSIRILRITPDDAKEILKHYSIKPNRHISEAKVLLWANCMKRGEWGIGDAIKFDIDGLLSDGQHRLKAVTVYDHPVDFVVITGYPKGSAMLFDRGKNRTIVDIAVLNGNDWFTNDILSTFNNLFRSIIGSDKKLPRMSDKQRIDCIIQLRQGLEFASLYQDGNGRKVRCASFRAVVARAYYSDIKIPEGLLNNFMAYVHGYTPLSDPKLFSEEYLDYSPKIALRLRDFYTAQEINGYTIEKGKGAFAIKYFIVQYALNKFIKKEKVSSLRLRTQDGNLFPAKLIDSMIDY